MDQIVSRFPDSANEISAYFTKASAPTQQDTLGQIVVEILRAGNNLNRKAICTKLLRRLETAQNAQEEAHYQTLIRMLFER